MVTPIADTRHLRSNLQRVSFYFSPHQDDWQLFMNPSAFQDVIDGGTKSIFIHVTAGDAGLGTKSGGRKHPLYLARDSGAEAAIRFMADADGRLPATKSVATATFNGHSIRGMNYRNTVAYFLRLPDGNPAGTGYAETGYQSLKRLAEGQVNTFTAIDNSTSYRDWTDLVATLRSIVDFESSHALSVRLNVSELDPIRNADDHSDHFMTAKAALDAACGLATRRVYYLGYASAKLPENLSGHDRDMKCAVYAATVAAILALDHPISWRHYDQNFIGRNYFRVEDDQCKKLA